MAASPTHFVSKAFPSSRRTLQYVEWTLLAVNAVLVSLDRFLYKGENAPPGGAYMVLVALGICAGLSVIFPLERPLWQRRVYVALDILSMLVAHQITIWSGWELLLYLALAKSCFLLGRKDVMVTTIATGVAWEISLALWLPTNIEFMRTKTPDIIAEDVSDPRRMIVSTLAGSITSYLAFSTFILLLCFLVLAEQKSRQKALALAAEVEILAAALERTRIAREIHDSLGHTLTTLDVQLELAVRLHSQNPERSLQALNIVKNLTSQSLQEVRRAVSTMREENFDLNTALITLVKQMNHNQAFKVNIQINLPKLPLQVNQQLYCIVKEGLTNIQKHSQASSIDLWGQSTSEGVSLGLGDDGVGFDLQAPVLGFGLRGMEERVHLLGGQVKINSAPGKGTLIQVTIPFGEMKNLRQV